MDLVRNRQFGTLITRLIQKSHLTREESRDAFRQILNNEITDMQQGAFLAALNAKGETAEEVAGAWEAIYEMDTIRVQLNTNGGVPVVENSGTGMDSFKTFNISTAASLIASSAGIPMARHGARAITSKCGTVDMAESLGVDVECSADIVAKSIETANIGLFNGMSPQIHPMALGRILSQIFFGSTLNIAASLANPAMPRRAVRGVYSKDMLLPVVNVMKAIGFERALVLHGGIDGSDKGMDEASVCGTTWCAELKNDGSIEEYEFAPKSFKMDLHDCSAIAPDKNIAEEPRRFLSLIKGKEHGARRDAAVLNAALIYYVAGSETTIESGIEAASKAIEYGRVEGALEAWVKNQNREPEKGLAKLDRVSTMIN
ncbi:TrpD1 [Desulfamplus magnetovallimortis]|uniref:Anthranilate phosphoribosyltransferase n=1 Tax=Desulfamplus magnetovallimortis TaxID=1246637 RepID=A0A1W1H6C1_9BACT|nr:anthranilate phosphoribosyltransferase [Desulfamplus magnetovallimortis]SLM27984.1 TrpD1 [Desulfamplus magnetovallimortis]